MADSGGTMAATIPVDPGPSNAPRNFLAGLQMAIADTECAQALLELATSIVPDGQAKGSPEDKEIENHQCSHSSPPEFPSSAAEWDSENHAPDKAEKPGPELRTRRSKPIRVKYSTKSPPDSCSRTGLKKAIEYSVVNKKIASGVGSQGKKTKLKKNKRLSSGETLRFELVKRIRLDHPYAWMGNERQDTQDEGVIPGLQDENAFKRYCESIKLGKFEDSGLEYGDESPAVYYPTENQELPDKETVQSSETDSAKSPSSKPSETDGAKSPSTKPSETDGAKSPSSKPSETGSAKSPSSKPSETGSAKSPSSKPSSDTNEIQVLHTYSPKTVTGSTKRSTKKPDPYEFEAGDDDVAVVPRLIHKKQPHVTLSPNNKSHVTSSPNNKPHVTSGPNNKPHVTSGPNNKPNVTSGPNNKPHVTSSPNNKPHETLNPSYKPHETSNPSNKPNVTLSPNNKPHTTSSLNNKPYVTSSPNNKRPRNTEGSKNVEQNKEDRFRNFQMLLQCLEKEGDEVSDTSDDSGNEDDDDEDEDGRSEDMEGDVLVSKDGSLLAAAFHCQCCNRTFSKKRYMTKHVHRMHPGTSLSDKNEVIVVCPNCGRMVPKKNFKRHSEVCKVHAKKSKKQLEMDLANCQFCGIRMRRHMLVKHLAQEHCVDNLDKETFHEVLSEGSDSCDSSDENFIENLQMHKKLFCGECNAVILRSQVRQHFAEKHVVRAPNQRQVACQLCGTELPKIQLVKHLAEMHCVEEISDNSTPSKHASKSNGQETKTPSPERPKPSCHHSMLARYINENNPSGSHGDKQPAAKSSAAQDVETCQTCVGLLTSSSVQSPISPNAGKIEVKNIRVFSSLSESNSQEVVADMNGASADCTECTPKIHKGGILSGIRQARSPGHTGNNGSSNGPRIQVVSSVATSTSSPHAVKVLSGTTGKTGNRTIVQLVADKSKTGSIDKLVKTSKPTYIPVKTPVTLAERFRVKPLTATTEQSMSKVLCSSPRTIKLGSSKTGNLNMIKKVETTSRGTIKTVTIYKGKNNKVHGVDDRGFVRTYGQTAQATTREKNPLVISTIPRSAASPSYKSGPTLRGSSGKV